MLESRMINEGGLVGVIYHFLPGDVLAAHWHPPEENHITIVSFGKFEVFGKDELDPKTVEATPRGKVLRWKPFEWHGFRALTEGSIVNIQTGMHNGG